MTRETKVGLVVASSFVCLVGVVVWQKMKKAPDDASPITIVASNDNQPKANPAPEPKKDVTGLQQAALQIPNQLPKDIFPPNINKDNPGAPALDPKLPALPPLPDPSEDPIEAMLKKAKLPGDPKNQDLKPPPLDQIAQNDKDAKDKLIKDLLPPPPIVPPAVDLKNLGDPKKDLLPPPAIDPKKDLLPPPPVVDPKKDLFLPVVTDLKKDLLPPLGDPKKDLLPPPLGDPKKDLLPPPLGGVQKDLPPLGQKDFPPPLVKNPDAKVNVTQVDTYSVQEQDTLAAISKKAYGSDKFAQAILVYNSKFNPEASVRGSLQGNRPQLFKGMPLLLPTREYFTNTYSQLIQDAPLVTNNNPPFSIKPPTNVADKTPNPNANPLVKANTPDKTRAYRVPDQGQHIFEIATQQLGNSRRWSEILRLNPSLRTEYPIPGGIEIQLPTN